VFDVSLQDAAGIVGLLLLFVWIAWFADRLRRGRPRSGRQIEMEFLKRRKK
jgi:hypothetical protein